MKPVTVVVVLAAAAAAWWFFRQRPLPNQSDPATRPTARPLPAPPLASPLPQPAPWRPVLPALPPTPHIEELPMREWKTPAIGAPYEADFIAASVAYDLPPGLLSRVAWQESRYDPRAESPAGAQGIMQIIPRWHPGVDPWNPKEAIPYAARYLAQNYRRFGSWSKALAAYNWGPTALANAIASVGEDWRTMAPRETRSYVADVVSDTGVA